MTGRVCGLELDGFVGANSCDVRLDDVNDLGSPAPWGWETASRHLHTRRYITVKVELKKIYASSGAIDFIAQES